MFLRQQFGHSWAALFPYRKKQAILVPKSSQLNIETTQGDFFALWIHSLTGTKVLGGCQLQSCHCCALTDCFSSVCSPIFRAGSILQGPDLWVESLVPFYLHCRLLARSIVTAPMFFMPTLYPFLQGLRGSGDVQLSSCLLGGIAWCCSHVAVSPGKDVSSLVAMGQLCQWHLPQESSPFFSWAGLFYSEDEVAGHWAVFVCWKELVNTSHCIAASTLCFPAAVQMSRTFLAEVQPELWWVLLIN